MEAKEDKEIEIKPVTRAMGALTGVQIEGSEHNERFSLLVLAFVGILAGYLNDQLSENPSAALRWVLPFLALSLLAALPAIWLSHVLALARVGISRSEVLRAALPELELREFLKVVGEAADWQLSRQFRFDRVLINPIVADDIGWDTRLRKIFDRFQALVRWQSLFMRLQIVFAALSALMFVFSYL